MAFKMGLDAADLQGGKAIPPGIYELRVAGFKPKKSKAGDSVNFNAQMEVVNHPEFDGTKIYETLSAKAGFTQYDFAHCFGIDLEDMGNGQYCLPGTWDGDLAAFKEDDPSTWKYDGPLIGRTGQAELAISNYLGKDSSKVKRYICAVPDCETLHPDQKHSTDLLKKN